MQALRVGSGAGPAGLGPTALSAGEEGLAPDTPRAAALSQEGRQGFLRRAALRTRVGGRSRKTWEAAQLPCRESPAQRSGVSMAACVRAKSPLSCPWRPWAMGSRSGSASKRLRGRRARLQEGLCSREARFP